MAMRAVYVIHGMCMFVVTIAASFTSVLMMFRTAHCRSLAVLSLVVENWAPSKLLSNTLQLDTFRKGLHGCLLHREERNLRLTSSTGFAY